MYLLLMVMSKGYNFSNFEAEFKKYLLSVNLSRISVKNYLSDLRHFSAWISWTQKEVVTGDTLLAIKDKIIEDYKKHLDTNTTPRLTINRRLSSIRRFFSFLYEKGFIRHNPTSVISNIPPKEIQLKTTHDILDNDSISNNKFTINIGALARKNQMFLKLFAFTKNKKILLASIVIAIIFFFASASKDQSLMKNQIPLVKNQGRTLLFKGKLLDTLGNSIDTKTDVSFRLYDKIDAVSPLYTGQCKGVHALIPDSAGTFSAEIGKDCQMNKIPDSLFTSNPSIYLGLTVASDKEMRPRQQVPNVGYALDSNKIQGLPLGLLKNSVPFINEYGEVLIESPHATIKSVGEESNLFLSSPNSLMLEAGAGDITFQASQSGSLRFKTGGILEPDTNLLISQNGNIGVGTENPELFKLQVMGNVGPEIGDYFDLGSSDSQWNTIFAGKILQNGVELCDKDGNNCPASAFTWINSEPYLYMSDKTSKVGIGTSSIDEIISKLYVTNDSSSISGKSLAIFNQKEDADILSASSSGRTQFVVNKKGYVGIGTINPAVRLDVSGGQTKLELTTQYTERLCHNGSDTANAQSSLIGDCSSTQADIAEYYGSLDQSLQPGMVVIASEGGMVIGKNTKAYVKKSEYSYDARVIGVVSTNPYDLFGQSFDSSEFKVPVALAGRVPVLISSDSDQIQAGDPLTATADGYAIKATEAGSIIGKALESWNKDSGKKEIVMFLSQSFYDPLLSVNNTGGIAKNQAEKTTAGYIYQGIYSSQNPQNYINLPPLTSSQTFLFISELVTRALQQLPEQPKISSPIVETGTLIATQAAILKQVETETIRGKDGTLTIDLESVSATSESTVGPLADLLIRGREKKVIAAIDGDGNASFSGKLIAEDGRINGDFVASSVQTNNLLVENSIQGTDLQVNNASVSGVLTAQTLDSENIRALEQRISSMEKVSSNSSTLLLANNNTFQPNSDENTVIDPQEPSSESTPDVSNSAGPASSKTELSEIQTLVAALKNDPLPDPEYYHSLESELTTKPNTLQSAVFDELAAIGDSSFYNLSVTGSLTAGSLQIKNDTLLSLSGDLNLTALNQITLFDGVITINRDGVMTTNGEIIAKKGVKTDTISSLNGTITMKLDAPMGVSPIPDPKLIIANANGLEVASIDASGSAQFNELKLNTYLEATSSSVLISAEDNYEANGIFAPAINTNRKIAGIGMMPEGSSEVIIYNEKIQEGSLIYLTPIDQTLSTQLSVLQKESCESDMETACKPYFKIAVNNSDHPELRFNWLIIN